MIRTNQMNEVNFYLMTILEEEELKYNNGGN